MTTQAHMPTHKQDKFKQFKTAANRVLRHDDDSGDTHDALFLAGHLSPDIVQMIESDQNLITKQAAEIARFQSELKQLQETVITFEPLSVPDTHYMAFRFGDRAWGFGKTKEEAREALQTQVTK